VSPPIPEPTRAVEFDQDAGPPFPAHPPAPHGKIVLGDSATRSADPRLREFLFAQGLQPIIPINTSWLGVGHVDEILSFVPDRRHQGFKVLWSSPTAMTALLACALQYQPSPLFRGKFDRGDYCEIEARSLLDKYKALNAGLDVQYLKPIQQRILAGLNLTEGALVPMPVLFGMQEHDDHPAAGAVTPNCVNVQVVDGHLLVPRPYGPRLPLAQARAAIKATLRVLRSPLIPVIRQPGGFHHWYESGEYIDRPALYYADGQRALIVKIIKAVQDDSDEVEALTVKLQQSREAAAIRAKRADVVFESGFTLQDYFDGGSPPKTLRVDKKGNLQGPCRVWIRDPAVDVVEAFIDTVTAPLGLHVHYVDCWSLHTAEGCAHCGSNAIRTPPSRAWWDDELQTPFPRYKVSG
jgi:Protein-arginine deiminase (PAD)